VRAAPAPAAAAAPMPLAPAPGPLPGDPRAKKAELDYFSLLSAHLNRRKSYPPEAKRAREEGVVTIRFTVDRDGNVSNAAIKRTSGHDLLDLATLDLLRRVAPLPRMPATMARDTVTIALPIEYALKTS
jgi:protein TonB